MRLQHLPFGALVLLSLTLVLHLSFFIDVGGFLPDLHWCKKEQNQSHSLERDSYSLA